MNLLASGFLKGPGGFLKGTTAGDMIKGTNSVNREVRIGVTYVSDLSFIFKADSLDHGQPIVFEFPKVDH